VKARELMSAQPACCTPNDTVQEAARLMRECDCGCIPVVEDKESNRLVGVITDRDIACRCTAEGKGSNTPVREAMSRDPNSCGPDDDIGAVERIMAEDQVRRVPVIDDRGRCIGIIAQADLPSIRVPPATARSARWWSGSPSPCTRRARRQRAAQASYLM
jgi:CBS domain-containing protein